MLRHLAVVVYASCLLTEPILAFQSQERRLEAESGGDTGTKPLQHDSIHQHANLFLQHDNGLQRRTKMAPPSPSSLLRHLDANMPNVPTTNGLGLPPDETPAPPFSIAFQRPQVFPEQGYQQQPNFNEGDRSENADLPEGFLEWAGTNAGVIQNFFSGNSKAPESYGNPAGGLLGQLARANLDFVVNDVPRLIAGRASSDEDGVLLGLTDRRRRPQDKKSDGSFVRSLVQAFSDGSASPQQPQQAQDMITLQQLQQQPQYRPPPDISEAWTRYQLQQQWIQELRSRLDHENSQKYSPLSRETNNSQPKKEESRS